MTKLIESKLQGLCKTCMRRKRCKDALRYLDMRLCDYYHKHGNRKDRRVNNNEKGYTLCL